MADRGKWGSKIGFILAAAGSAIGLGNIWRFPYTASKSGGALFVFVYLIAVLTVALPVLIAEVSLGRFTNKNPVGAFKAIKPKGQWKLVGALGIVTGVMILSYYAVIAGWTIGYFLKALSGKFNFLTGVLKEKQIDEAKKVFQNFSDNHFLQILFLAIFLGLTVYVISRGVSGGIEKFSKILMPLLFGIMILLVIRSVTLEGASKGITKYIVPDFSTFRPQIILEAMGQAFFSLSLGMGTMITYGSYVSKRENLPSSVGWIAAFDTGIAIIAGLIIFPALYALTSNPEILVDTPDLVFNVFPVIFMRMAGGFIFGPLFFLLLSIAALTSTISLLEVPVTYFVDEKKWNRKKAAILVGIITLAVGIPSALSPKFLGTMNFIWGNLALSIGALFIAIFVGYIWKTSNALQEISHGNEKFKLGGVWVIFIKYITPLAVLIVLVVGILILGLRF